MHISAYKGTYNWHQPMRISSTLARSIDHTALTQVIHEGGGLADKIIELPHEYDVLKYTLLAFVVI